MISVKDMADLVHVYDAYITINKALFGDAVLLGFYEGNFGAISRIFNVIERNVIEELKKDDYKATREILDDSQRTGQKGCLGNSIAQDCLKKLKDKCFYGSI